MVRTIPVLECLSCGAEWRCYKSKRKLRPSRNCPKCFIRLKIENEDYKWIDTGNFEQKTTERTDTIPEKRPSSRKSEIPTLREILGN